MKKATENSPSLIKKKIKLRKMAKNLAIVFILCAAGIALAQNAKRIEFAKGNTSATVKGVGKQSYVFRVGDEQTLKIRLVSKGNRATFDLIDSQGSDLSEGTDGRTLEMTTTVAGEYQLNVSAAKGTNFTLTVSIK